MERHPFKKKRVVNEVRLELLSLHTLRHSHGGHGREASQLERAAQGSCFCFVCSGPRSMTPSATKKQPGKNEQQTPSATAGAPTTVEIACHDIDVVLHHHSADHTHELKAMHRLLANSFWMWRIMAQSVARPSRGWRRYSARQPALDSPLRVSLPAKNDERHAGNVFLTGVPVPEEREIPVNWLRSTSSSMYSPLSWRATTYQGPEFKKKTLGVPRRDPKFQQGMDHRTAH